MDVLLDFIWVIVSIILLWKGADVVVNSASHIAHKFGVSDLVIGLTVVAVGTSAPEFAVTIRAALIGKSTISVGNVVGSNIFNLGFILGGTAAIRAIQTNPKLVWRDGLFLFSVTVLLYLFFFGFSIEIDKNQTYGLVTWQGLVLVGLLIGYLIYLFMQREEIDEEIPEGKGDWKDWFWLVGGLAAIIGGGDLLVNAASDIARVAGISEWVIAVTIVAAGTSAPEFATAIVAAFKEKHGMAIGNLIGSDLFNLLGVLGVAALLSPSGVLAVPASAWSSLVILVVMVALVIFFMRTGWKLGRLEGGFLVGLNLVRWIFDFITKSTPQ